MALFTRLLAHLLIQVRLTNPEMGNKSFSEIIVSALLLFAMFLNLIALPLYNMNISK
jgi:hypothetical protein